MVMRAPFAQIDQPVHRTKRAGTVAPIDGFDLDMGRLVGLADQPVENFPLQSPPQPFLNLPAPNLIPFVKTGAAREQKIAQGFFLGHAVLNLTHGHRPTFN